MRSVEAVRRVAGLSGWHSLALRVAVALTLITTSVWVVSLETPGWAPWPATWHQPALERKQDAQLGIGVLTSALALVALWATTPKAHELEFLAMSNVGMGFHFYSLDVMNSGSLIDHYLVQVRLENPVPMQPPTEEDRRLNGWQPIYELGPQSFFLGWDLAAERLYPGQPLPPLSLNLYRDKPAQSEFRVRWWSDRSGPAIEAVPILSPSNMTEANMARIRSHRERAWR